MFLTDLDERARVKGSRDPLGLVPIWSKLGREVVGNLSTVTNSVRGFTTLLLGLHFAEEIVELERGAGQSELESFLKFEQLAGYVRVRSNNDDTVRGVRRVRERLNSRRQRISAAPADQILSNQKVYGLWGLFSMPARASELLEKGQQRLTAAAREFVARHYVPFFGNARAVRSFLDLLRREAFEFQPDGRDAALAEALSKCHARRLRNEEEKAFYREHLAWGGPADSTQERQRQLAMLLAQHETKQFGFPDFRAIRKQVGKMHGARPLAVALERIEAMERLLSAARVLFGYLLTQNDQTLGKVAAAVRKEWKTGPRMEREILAELHPMIANAGGSTILGTRWMTIAEALEGADFERALRLLVEMNTEVMQMRNGSTAWLTVDDGRLRVRMADETEELYPRTEVEDLWRSTYFINSLWVIARETA